MGSSLVLFANQNISFQFLSAGYLLNLSNNPLMFWDIKNQPKRGE